MAPIVRRPPVAFGLSTTDCCDHASSIAAPRIPIGHDPWGTVQCYFPNNETVLSTPRPIPPAQCVGSSSGVTMWAIAKDDGEVTVWKDEKSNSRLMSFRARKIMGVPIETIVSILMDDNSARRMRWVDLLTEWREVDRSECKATIYLWAPARRGFCSYDAQCTRG